LLVCGVGGHGGLVGSGLVRLLAINALLVKRGAVLVEKKDFPKNMWWANWSSYVLVGEFVGGQFGRWAISLIGRFGRWAIW